MKGKEKEEEGDERKRKQKGSVTLLSVWNIKNNS